MAYLQATCSPTLEHTNSDRSIRKHFQGQGMKSYYRAAEAKQLAPRTAEHSHPFSRQPSREAAARGPLSDGQPPSHSPLASRSRPPQHPRSRKACCGHGTAHALDTFAPTPAPRQRAWRRNTTSSFVKPALTQLSRHTFHATYNTARSLSCYTALAHARQAHHLCTPHMCPCHMCCSILTRPQFLIHCRTIRGRGRVRIARASARVGKSKTAAVPI